MIKKGDQVKIVCENLPQHEKHLFGLVGIVVSDGPGQLLIEIAQLPNQPKGIGALVAFEPGCVELLPS